LSQLSAAQLQLLLAPQHLRHPKQPSGPLQPILLPLLQLLPLLRLQLQCLLQALLLLLPRSCCP
jgi:hypothetical protein